MSWMQLTQSDSDQLTNSFEPIMEYLDIRFAWQRQDDAIRMTFERENAQ